MVADLGLAKAMAAASGLTARAGTPGYMAPEQDDPSSTVDERGRRVRAGPARPAAVRIGRTVAGMAAVLARATATAPADRYRDAEAFARALAEAVTSGDRPEPRRRRGGHRRLAVALVLAAVTAAGAVAVDAWRDRPVGVATDASGRISVRLPPSWRAEGAGWARRPAPGGGLALAMVISPEPGHWVTDAEVPGAFIGLSDTREAATGPADFLAGQPTRGAAPSRCGPPAGPTCSGPSPGTPGARPASRLTVRPSRVRGEATRRTSPRADGGRGVRVLRTRRQPGDVRPRGEALYPPVERDVIHLDASFDQ